MLSSGMVLLGRARQQEGTSWPKVPRGPGAGLLVWLMDSRTQEPSLIREGKPRRHGGEPGSTLDGAPGSSFPPRGYMQALFSHIWGMLLGGLESLGPALQAWLSLGSHSPQPFCQKLLSPTLGKIASQIIPLHFPSFKHSAGDT